MPILLVVLFLASTLQAARPAEILADTSELHGFDPVFEAVAIPTAFQEKMRQSTWRKGCPVGIESLRLLNLSYWNFDRQPVFGQLIVHEDVAKETVELFRLLFQRGYLIEQMQPIEAFGGNDELSMGLNNTSAFNCRDITGQPGKFSQHAYGRAIDINPRTNPYIKGDQVQPANAKQFVDRSKVYPGSIVADGFVTGLFESNSWRWGGRWKDRKDYQHFEKPAPIVP